MVRSGRVLPNTNPMPESDKEKFWKRKIAKKKLFMERAVKFVQSRRVGRKGEANNILI
jgi:hypothetical protein